MSRRPARAAALGPVSVTELQAAVLTMIAERFKGRVLTIETAERALALASFDLKMAHLRAVAGEGT